MARQDGLIAPASPDHLIDRQELGEMLYGKVRLKFRELKLGDIVTLMLMQRPQIKTLELLEDDHALELMVFRAIALWGKHREEERMATDNANAADNSATNNP